MRILIGLGVLLLLLVALVATNRDAIERFAYSWEHHCQIVRPGASRLAAHIDGFTANIFVGRVINRRSTGTITSQADPFWPFNVTTTLPEVTYTIAVEETIATTTLGEATGIVEVLENRTGLPASCGNGLLAEDHMLHSGEVAIFVTSRTASHPYRLVHGARDRFRIVDDRQRREMTEQFSPALLGPHLIWKLYFPTPEPRATIPGTPVSPGKSG